MKNGRADHDDDEPGDPKITRIEDARRRRQLGLDGGNGAKKQGASAKLAGRGVGELLFGAVIVAMAVVRVVSVTRPLWQGALSFAP